jgi:hypothetical protein
VKAVLLRTMNDPISATLRERYFRGISDRFIALRGAPFSLSPADVSLISAWESAGIPLDVVLEGIDQSFALRPGRPHAPGKIRTLSFCRASVERAFERHRERAVGGKHPAVGVKTPEKKGAARTALEEFLARRPSELSAIMPEYENAVALLSVERPDDEALERLDERIDAALRESASPAARREAASAVGRDHPELGGSDKKAAIEILLAKSVREKFRVPYASLFYY